MTICMLFSALTHLEFNDVINQRRRLVNYNGKCIPSLYRKYISTESQKNIFSFFMLKIYIMLYYPANWIVLKVNTKS